MTWCAVATIVQSWQYSITKALPNTTGNSAVASGVECGSVGRGRLLVLGSGALPLGDVPGNRCDGIRLYARDIFVGDGHPKALEQRQ